MHPDITNTQIFRSYWVFAAERHAMYLRRLRGEPGPWTVDPILSAYRFTNSFRAADRVSQFLIRDVQYDRKHSSEDIVFRTVLFRWFNKIDTWTSLCAQLGDLEAATFDPMRADRVLSQIKQSGRRIYSAAYIVPPVPGEFGTKHTGHLLLTRKLLDNGLSQKVEDSASLRDLFELLKRIPGVGNFLAYQLAIDLNYSVVTNHDEDEFVMPGPGALDGISKLFPGSRLRPERIIRWMVDEQDYWFDHFGLHFDGLFGRRLQLIDCQNLFCEISKYTRVAFPDIPGISGRTRIKQGFRKAGPIPPPLYPPKWGLKEQLAAPVGEPVQLT